MHLFFIFIVSQRKKEHLSMFLEIAETCQYFALQSRLCLPPFLAVRDLNCDSSVGRKL